METLPMDMMGGFHKPLTRVWPIQAQLKTAQWRFKIDVGHAP